MTIALAVLVTDGVVLAADSATTLIGQDASGATRVINVYDSANKIFNLHKGSRLGAYTYGAGSIGEASIATLAKDFRVALTEGVAIGPSGWTFNAAAHTVEEVAIAARHFLFEERYATAYATAGNKPVFGFNVAGYSSGAERPELWEVRVDDTGACSVPTALRRVGESGMTWHGEPEAIQRLVVGFGSKMGEALVAIGLAPADVPAAITLLQAHLEVPLVPPALPIQDAIELAEFLVHLTIKFSKFKPGAPTVGGPLEVLAITKHEGSKWVRRKHYYDAVLNPAN